MMHVGDIMSTSGDVQYNGVFNINQLTQCTQDFSPMYSWYPPDVLNTHYTGW